MDYTKFLGIPYVLGGTDPAVGLDCWTFFRYYQKERYGVDVPYLTVEEYNFFRIRRKFNQSFMQQRNQDLPQWSQVMSTKIEDGDAILFNIIGDTPTHIATAALFDGHQYIVHADKPLGSATVPLSDTKRRGWAIHSVYRIGK